MGTFNDGYDELICFKVDEKGFKEEPLAPSVNFTEVQLYARAVPAENGGEVLQHAVWPYTFQPRSRNVDANGDMLSLFIILTCLCACQEYGNDLS